MKIPPPHDNYTPKKQARRAIARRLSALLPQARRASAPLPLRGIHRILVCRATKTLGETLLLSPLLRELETVYPGAEVDLVTRCGAAQDMFEEFPQVRTIHVLPPRMLRQPWRLWRTLRRLRSLRYDLAIDPYLLSHTDRSLMRIARAHFTVGFDGRRKSGYVSHAVAEPQALQHAGKLPVYLLRRAIDPVQEPAQNYPNLEIRLRAEERDTGAQVLARVSAAQAPQALPRRGVIGVYAHATGSKLFDADWWSRLLPIVQTRFSQHAIVEILPMFAESLLGERFATYYSSDVRHLAAFLANLDLFVSADCGVMHLASASGAPTVGIFSVTDIPGWSVYGPHDLTIDARRRSAEDVAAEIVAAYGDRLAPMAAT